MSSLSKRVKAPAQTVRVPQTRDEVSADIAEIGRLIRERARIEAAMGDAIAKVREGFEAEAQPLGARMTALHSGVQTWCEAHRAELTAGGKTKTAVFTTGEVRWRMTPPSVALRGIEAVMAALRERGLLRFIREKQEVNKEAILAEPAAVAGIPGILVRQEEEFVVVPHEAELVEAG